MENKFNIDEAVKIIADVLQEGTINELTIKKEDDGKFELWGGDVYIGRYSTSSSEEVVKKTGFEWCLEANLRVLKLEDWSTFLISSEESYFTEKITKDDFYSRIEKCHVKANSMPRKTPIYLEYRMYGLVAYQLSGTIHAGIQFGHAVVDYGRTVEALPPHEKIYKKWADKDKTFIILNGGTTNNNPERLGSLNQHMNTLRDNGLLLQEFHEPDLGDQLTAFVFLVDERVFNKTLYPDFIGTPYPWPSNKKPSESQYSKWEGENKRNYDAWVERIGGEKNAFLREYLRNLRLA